MTNKQSFKFRLSAFTKSTCVMDLRDPLDTRRHRAERFERKNKTNGKRSVYHVG